MFEYKVKITRVIDGDTVDGMIDLGFSVYRKIRIRLYGMNATESLTNDLEEQERGLLAKSRLRDILEENDYEVDLKSFGVGKFGRCLGELFYYKHNPENWEDEFVKTSINNQLIEEGHAVKYFGGRRQYER